LRRRASNNPAASRIQVRSGTRNGERGYGCGRRRCRAVAAGPGWLRRDSLHCCLAASYGPRAPGLAHARTDLRCSAAAGDAAWTDQVGDQGNDGSAARGLGWIQRPRRRGARHSGFLLRCGAGRTCRVQGMGAGSVAGVRQASDLHADARTGRASRWHAEGGPESGRTFSPATFVQQHTTAGPD